MLLKDTVKFIDLSVMEDYEKQAIAERHLISPQMMDNSIKRGILLSDDNKLSILLNEEDHIRIQAMEAGFDLDACFDLANRVDDLIEDWIPHLLSHQRGDRYAGLCDGPSACADHERNGQPDH